MANTIESIRLAIIGCGTTGRIRANFARQYPGIEWLGLCDLDSALGKQLAEDTSADFFTTDFEELLDRSEVNAVMVLTDENRHTAPALKAADNGHKLFIEKPLVADALESRQILKGRDTKTFVAACIHIACREEEIPSSHIIIAKKTN